MNYFVHMNKSSPLKTGAELILRQNDNGEFIRYQLEVY